MFLNHRYTVLLIIFAFVIFSAASVFITYPVLFNLNSIVTGFGDELIITWIQNFILHHGMDFNANIYFPYKNSLAYSDFLLTSSLIAWLPLLIFKVPIVTFNFTLISSLILLGFSIFLTCIYLTKNYYISIFSGLLFIFSPAVLDKKVHVQILGIEWVIFSMLLFIIFINTNKIRFLIVSVIFFILQIYNSFMPGYFILLFYVVTFFTLLLADKNKASALLNKKILVVFLTSAIFIIPILIPYFQVSHEFKYQRDIRETIHFALQPEDLLVSGDDSRFKYQLDKIFSQSSYPENAEIKNGFIGLIFSIFSIIFIFYFIKKFHKKNFIFNSIFITGIFGLVLSLGPFLHFNRLTIHHPFPIPLPYLLFYYVLPGFNGFRNSARWEMLFVICFAIGIAIMLNEMLRKYSVNTRIIICFILTTAVILEYNFPMNFQSTRVLETPKVYSILSENDNVVFVPLCSWNDRCANLEFKRNYYSTANFPKTLNGVSGFSPPPWERFVGNFNKHFPDEKSLDQLRKMKVKYLVFEKANYDIYYTDGQQKLDSLRNNSGIKEIYRFDNTYVFEL